MTFEAQQKSVQDIGSYEGAKIYCLQKLEPEQWRFCDTKYRLDFKICQFTFKATHGLAPSHLSNLITVKKDQWLLPWVTWMQYSICL